MVNPVRRIPCSSARGKPELVADGGVADDYARKQTEAPRSRKEGGGHVQAGKNGKEPAGQKLRNRAKAMG
jgi:hypothetical protein